MTEAALVEAKTAFSSAKARLDSIDLLRGMVMVVMALDHVRDYFTNARFDPLDLAQTTPAYYVTRWITHFAAPTFVFLAGTAAFLSGRRKSRADLSRFLLTRGLWLVALEITVVTFAWTFSPLSSILIAQVIWAIGWSMVALAALVWLPFRAVAATGIGVVALHNLLDPLTPEAFGSAAWVWMALHDGGFSALGAAPLVFGYPILPWIGIMAAGYAFGSVMTWEREKRDRFLVRLGLAMVAAFFVLRATNVYGDPRPWAPQATLGLTVMDFMKVEKYPPSLDFALITLGPMIAILPLLDRASGWVLKFFATYGRAPLAYYVLHLYLIHALAVVAGVLAGYSPSQLTLWIFLPATYGWGLPLVYLVWVGVVLTLWWPTKAWGELKARRKDWWLSYL